MLELSPRDGEVLPFNELVESDHQLSYFYLSRTFRTLVTGENVLNELIFCWAERLALQLRWILARHGFGPNSGLIRP